MNEKLKKISKWGLLPPFFLVMCLTSINAQPDSITVQKEYTQMIKVIAPKGQKTWVPILEIDKYLTLGYEIKGKPKMMDQNGKILRQNSLMKSLQKDVIRALIKLGFDILIYEVMPESNSTPHVPYFDDSTHEGVDLQDPHMHDIPSKNENI